MSRVLVTGGAGFIGSHLCERLLAAVRKSGATYMMAETSFYRPEVIWAREAREANLKALRDLIPAGSRIFTSIKHVAPSGKTTSVNPFSVGADLDVVYLDNTRIAEAIGFTPDGKNGGIRVQGTAADPGAVLVSALASALYGKPDALSHRPV